MTYALRSSASLLAGIAFLTICSAVTASAEDLQFSVYGGYQTAPHSGVDLSDGTHFTAGWEGKSFGAPPYYGGRVTWWLENFNKPNWGISLDYTHVVSCLGWGSHALAPLSFKAASYSGVFTLLPLLTGEGRAHHGEIMFDSGLEVQKNYQRNLEAIFETYRPKPPPKTSE